MVRISSVKKQPSPRPADEEVEDFPIPLSPVLNRAVNEVQKVFLNGDNGPSNPHRLQLKRVAKYGK